MSHFLPRGYHIDDQNKITKMLSSGGDWQIYLTNRGAYVLAVKLALYDKWVSDYDLPTSIFRDSDNCNYKVYASTSHYIVSSIERGPFPGDNGQIEAFSIAFKTARDLFPDADVHDALYIEEFSLILPVSFGANLVDSGIVYGKWLTGGINISIESIDKVSKIMSWLPKNALHKVATLAGFDIPIEMEIESEDQLKESGPIIDIVLHQEQYKRMGISFPGATILYGPRGVERHLLLRSLPSIWAGSDLTLIQVQ